MKATPREPGTWDIAEGEYSRHSISTAHGEFDALLCWPPGAPGRVMIGYPHTPSAEHHEVVFHEDGTAEIPVISRPNDANSLLVYNHDMTEAYHGHLVGGEWT